MASDAIHLLNVPPSREVAEHGLLAPVRAWFAAEFGAPTLAQRFAWPTIHHDQHLLLSSPTGSGKTLAAFLPIISNLLVEPRPGLQCLYVAPLKALSCDVRINLKKAWRSLQNAGLFENQELTVGVRTGDTPQRVRHRQLSDPPAILLTTPESLAQLLASPTSLPMLQSLRWVIVDEIHSLLSNKRAAPISQSASNACKR